MIIFISSETGLSKSRHPSRMGLENCEDSRTRTQMEAKVEALTYKIESLEEIHASVPSIRKEANSEELRNL